MASRCPKAYDIAVPKKETENAKKYVAHKIHQAIRRGAKSIDREALEWCKGFHSPTDDCKEVTLVVTVGMSLLSLAVS